MKKHLVLVFILTLFFSQEAFVSGGGNGEACVDNICVKIHFGRKHSRGTPEQIRAANRRNMQIENNANERAKLYAPKLAKILNALEFKTTREGEPKKSVYVEYPVEVLMNFADTPSEEETAIIKSKVDEFIESQISDEE